LSRASWDALPSSLEHASAAKEVAVKQKNKQQNSPSRMRYLALLRNTGLSYICTNGRLPDQRVPAGVTTNRETRVLLNRMEEAVPRPQAAAVTITLER
jgi:hypothetical protein